MRDPEFMKVPFSSLHDWKKNPRTITKEDIKRLAMKITEKGLIRNFVCWQEDGEKKKGIFTVGGGNMRFFALRDILKIKPEREVWISLNFPESEKEKIELSLLDNMTSGSYIDQQLAELIYPYRDMIPLQEYRLNFNPGVDLKKFLEGFGPTEIPDIDLLDESDRHTISIYCRNDEELIEMREMLGISDKKTNKIEATELKSILSGSLKKGHG